MSKYLFIEDPGHAWLRVPLSDMTKEVAGAITPYSYMDRKYAYLEEDLDAWTFLCWKYGDKITSRELFAQGIIDTEYQEHTSIRDKSCFDPHKKDLLGRPVLQGGAAGEQKEFLDIHDYKTVQEREKVNAKRDCKGQKALF